MSRSVQETRTLYIPQCMAPGAKVGTNFGGVVRSREIAEARTADHIRAKDCKNAHTVVVLS